MADMDTRFQPPPRCGGNTKVSKLLVFKMQKISTTEKTVRYDLVNNDHMTKYTNRSNEVLFIV